jgi:hypothetical protein
MALSLTITTVHGIEIQDAYHRVESVNLTTKDSMRFHVRTYVSLDKPFACESVHVATYDIDGENPIRQAYEHLKMLPEFAGATDC